MGMVLFERDTRGYRATQDAKRLIPHAESIEAAAEGITGAAEKSRRANARPIRLTAPAVNFSDNLSQALADFTADNPGVRFEMVASYKVLDLAAGEADVAIRIARKIEDERLICRKLTTATSSLYASRIYVARHGLPTCPEEFAGHFFIGYDNPPAAWVILPWMLARSDPGQIVSSCADIESMNSAVRAGLGIGSIATPIGEEDDTLVRCFPPPDLDYPTAWLVISPEAWRRPEVKAFAAFFAPRFRPYIKHGHR
jgi:DNA-binding transcriptional LysR family regulator